MQNPFRGLFAKTNEDATPRSVATAVVIYATIGGAVGGLWAKYRYHPDGHSAGWGGIVAIAALCAVMGAIAGAAIEWQRRK
jgi:hypothetical protein